MVALINTLKSQMTKHDKEKNKYLVILSEPKWELF